MQVNACRTENMEAEPLKYTGTEMTSMLALISSVSRGMPVNVATDGPVAEAWEAGKELYYTRTGQLELSCANCHEDNYGRMIRADHLSQGQINGFPVYRVQLGVLQPVDRKTVDLALAEMVGADHTTVIVLVTIGAGQLQLTGAA